MVSHELTSPSPPFCFSPPNLLPSSLQSLPALIISLLSLCIVTCIALRLFEVVARIDFDQSKCAVEPTSHSFGPEDIHHHSLMSDPGAYTVPRPGRIRLKESHDERATRLHRDALKQFEKRRRKIARANGFEGHNVSDPPIAGPSRFPQHEHAWVDDRLDAMEEMMEEHERMAWMMHEEMHRSEGGLYGDVRWGYVRSTRDDHVPNRYRNAASGSTSSTGARGGGMDLGGMTEGEYAEYIMEGMQKRHDQAEAKEREERRRKRQEEEKEEYLRRERENAREERRREKRDKKRRQADRKQMEEERKRKAHGGRVGGDDIQWVSEEEVMQDRSIGKKGARERYTERWKAITIVGGEIEEVDLSYEDVPWPVYRKADLDRANVREFMVDLAKDTREDVKKTLREAIRAYHPDRFFGRILPRVREADREKVKEGVELCSRIINDLASAL